MTANKNQELLIYEEQYFNFYNKLSTSGLTNSDYKKVVVLMRELRERKYHTTQLYQKFLEQHNSPYFDKEEFIVYQSIKKHLYKVDELYGRYFELAELLKHNVVPRTLKNFLNDECSLVHMVLTNNPQDGQIKMNNLDDFVFFCQFHNESSSSTELNPSLYVNSRTNRGHCCSCDINFYLIDYFMQKEGLTYQEAVNLLAKIYLINLKNQEYPDNNPIVQKYRHILLSPEYKALVEEGIIRVSSKEPTWIQKRALAKLRYDLETIKRIEQEDTIRFYGKKPDCYRLVLSKEEVSKRLK